MSKFVERFPGIGSPNVLAIKIPQDLGRGEEIDLEVRDNSFYRRDVLLAVGLGCSGSDDGTWDGDFFNTQVDASIFGALMYKKVNSNDPDDGSFMEGPDTYVDGPVVTAEWSIGAIDPAQTSISIGYGGQFIDVQPEFNSKNILSEVKPSDDLTQHGDADDAVCNPDGIIVVRGKVGKDVGYRSET